MAPTPTPPPPAANNSNGSDDPTAAYLDPADVGQQIDIDQDVPGLKPDDDDTSMDDIADELKDSTVTDQQPSIPDDSICGYFRHNDSIYSCATFGQYVVTGDGEDEACKAYVWDIDSGTMLQQLATHKDSITSIEFSVDGNMCATAGMDGVVNVYRVNHDIQLPAAVQDLQPSAALETPPFTLLHTLTGPSAEIEWLAWHPKGNVLAVAGADTTVWLYNAESGVEMRVFTGHIGSVLCGTWSHDGKLLVTGGDDGVVYVWDPKTGSHKFPKITSDSPVTSIAPHLQQNLIVIGCSNGQSKVINLDNGTVVATYAPPGSAKDESAAAGVEGTAFSNSSVGGMKLVATGHVDGAVRLYDMANGSIRATARHTIVDTTKQQQTESKTADDMSIEEAETSVTRLEFHRTLPILITSSLDGTVRVWDARNLAPLKAYSGHHQAVLTYAVNYQKRMIVTGSDDHVSLVFNLDDIKQQQPQAVR